MDDRCALHLGLEHYFVIRNTISSLPDGGRRNDTTMEYDMKTLITLAFALTALSVALPFPAFAGSDGAIAVPYCASNAGSDHDTKSILTTELLVKNLTILSLDDWNGCLKAITVDSHGKSMTTFYDDSLNVVAQNG